nr:unnamed protein product [Digitaria exilis]
MAMVMELRCGTAVGEWSVWGGTHWIVCPTCAAGFRHGSLSRWTPQQRKALEKKEILPSCGFLFSRA